jgi:hypothetical protein
MSARFLFGVDPNQYEVGSEGARDQDNYVIADLLAMASATSQSASLALAQALLGTPSDGRWVGVKWGGTVTSSQTIPVTSQQAFYYGNGTGYRTVTSSRTVTTSSTAIIIDWYLITDGVYSYQYTDQNDIG